jgi:hypothetical protein
MHSIEFTLDRDGRVGRLRKPDVTKYGIYLIRCGRHVIRVGESSSGFDRIFKGFRQKLRHIRRGKERKNYLAYSWRAEYKNQTMSVDYFSLSSFPFSKDLLRRALEAEITFQLRLARRKWPRNMSEIHFLERYRINKALMRKAMDVLATYGHKYNPAV